MANYQSNYTGTQIDAGISAIRATADYIVEQGVTDGWIWRKWNSGVAECWFNHSLNTDIKSTYGNVFESGKFPAVNYPFAFVEIPLEFASPGNNTACGWVEVSSGTNQTVTHTNVYQLAVGKSNTESSMNYINLYVIGKWK